LETFLRFFPSLGKISAKSSNAWKKQWFRFPMLGSTAAIAPGGRSLPLQKSSAVGGAFQPREPHHNTIAGLESPAHNETENRFPHRASGYFFATPTEPCFS